MLSFDYEVCFRLVVPLAGYHAQVRSGLSTQVGNLVVAAVDVGEVFIE